MMKIRYLMVATVMAFGISACGSSTSATDTQAAAAAVSGLKVPNKVEAVVKN